MKKPVATFWDLIATLILLGLGIALVYGYLFDAAFAEHFMSYLQVPLLGASLGALMLFSVLMRWLGLLSRSREKFVDYDSGKGSVGISTRAIRDFVERVGSDFAAVKGIESRLSPSRKGIDLSLKVKVQAGTRIPELSELMQQQIREQLQESLGLEKIGRIAIHVQEIVGEVTASAETVVPEFDH